MMESIQFFIFLLFSLKQVYAIATHTTFESRGPTVGTCSGARGPIFNDNQNGPYVPRITVEQKSDCDFYQAITPGGRPGDPGYQQSRSRDHEGSASLPKLPQCGGRSELPLDYSQCPCAVKGQGGPQYHPLPTISVEELRQQPGFCPSDLQEGSLSSLLKPQYPSTHDLHRSGGGTTGRVYGKSGDGNIGGESKGAFSMPSGFSSSNKGTTDTDDINRNGREIPNDCGLYFS